MVDIYEWLGLVVNYHNRGFLGHIMSIRIIVSRPLITLIFISIRGIKNVHYGCLFISLFSSKLNFLFLEILDLLFLPPPFFTNSFSLSLLNNVTTRPSLSSGDFCVASFEKLIALLSVGTKPSVNRCGARM